MRKEYKQMMDQLSPREELVEQVLAQAGAHAEQKHILLPPPWKMPRPEE